MQKRATMFSHIAQLVGVIPWLHRYASPKHLQKSMGQKLVLLYGASLQVITFIPAPQSLPITKKSSRDKSRSPFLIIFQQYPNCCL